MTVDIKRVVEVKHLIKNDGSKETEGTKGVRC